MDNREADALLNRWGIWSRDYHRIGWPSTSILSRIMVEGTGGAAHQNICQDIPMPDDVAQAERVIRRMDYNMRRVTKCRYLWKLTDNDGAKRCRCGKTSYRERVEKAQRFLAWNIKGD